MIRGAFAFAHCRAISFFAVLAQTFIARSGADFVKVENNECEHIREQGGSWIYDPHWFGTPKGGGSGEGGPYPAGDGEGCPGGLMYMCEPKWSAEAHPEDVGNGWSIPMFLEKEQYLPGEGASFYCNDQIATSRGGLNGGVLGKFTGWVNWTCTRDGWTYDGICERARYCRARTGEIKLSPSRSLEETSLALIHVDLDVHELQRYETQWFPCDKCTAHDVDKGAEVTHCGGKVLLRCDEKGDVIEVDNLCTPAKHKGKHDSDSSLLEVDDSDVSVARSLTQAKSFLHGQPGTKKSHKAHSDDHHGRSPNWRGHQAERRHEA